MPPESNAANDKNLGAAGNYAATDDEFNLPDPSVAATSFDPSKGEPFLGSPEPENPSGQTDPLLDPSATGEASPAQPNTGLINAFATADELFAKGQLKEALATLSVFYGTPNLNETQRDQLLSRLDPLAREVIYSQRHLLEQPHRISASGTLVQVAARYDVPWQLLANINRVEDPIAILPGTELKVVRGPFRAEVSVTKKELTLFLGDLYAGRFNIEVGNDPPPAPGTYSVQEKQTSHVYYDRSGAPVAAGSAENPYGNAWLDWGGQLCIHGSPSPTEPSKQGCISLAGNQAEDLYGILSQGSAVSIRR